MRKFLYFELHGRGSASKFLLKHKGIPFAVEVPGKDGVKTWPKWKKEFPLRGGLPWYTDENGKVHTQS